MPRISRSQRARRRVSPLDRLLLALHGSVQGGSRDDAAAAWDLIGGELIEEALARAAETGGLPRLPEAWWRWEPGVPKDLRPYELPNGRCCWVGDVINRRAAWLREHAQELGLVELLA